MPVPTTWRSVNVIESKLERLKEVTGIETDWEALDRALDCALLHEDLLEVLGDELYEDDDELDDYFPEPAGPKVWEA